MKKEHECSINDCRLLAVWSDGKDQWCIDHAPSPLERVRHDVRPIRWEDVPTYNPEEGIMQFKDGDHVRNIFKKDWGVGVILMVITARSAHVGWPFHPTSPGSSSVETFKNLEKVED